MVEVDLPARSAPVDCERLDPMRLEAAIRPPVTFRPRRLAAAGPRPLLDVVETGGASAVVVEGAAPAPSSPPVATTFSVCSSLDVGSALSFPLLGDFEPAIAQPMLDTFCVSVSGGDPSSRWKPSLSPRSRWRSQVGPLLMWGI